MLHILLNYSSTKNCAVAIATIVVEKQKNYSKVINWTKSTFGGLFGECWMTVIIFLAKLMKLGNNILKKGNYHTYPISFYGSGV